MSEGPYKLPKGWRWVRLGEVCEYERRTIDPQRFPEKTFYLHSIPAYDNGQRPEKLCGRQIGSSKIVIGPGVCLFSKLNPRIPRAWVVAEVPLDGTPIASTEFMPLRPISNVLDLSYLGKLLMTNGFLSQVRSDVTGATGSRQRLKPEVILHALIPLPPLEEQRRVVARVEALMERVREAKRLRQQAREDAERLWQSVLAATFPRLGSELPEGWRWVQLGEVVEVWDNLRKPVRKEDRHPGNVPYCGANGVIDYVEGHTHEGDFVLLAEDGGFYGPYEASAYIMSGRFWANNHIHVLRGQPDLLINGYLCYWLNTCDLRPYLTGATRPKLTQASMLQIPIPLPPLEEQRRIVAHLEAVRAKLQALKEAQAETDAVLGRLEQAILDKAFRGEL